VVHPRARLTAGYDSNTTQSSANDESGFLGLALGSTAVWLPLEDQRFTVEGVIEGDTVRRVHRDGLAGLGSLAWEDQGEPVYQEAKLHWLRNDSPSLVVTGRQIQRDEYTASYDGTLVGDGLSFGGGPLVFRQRFLADGLDFVGDTRDATTWGGQVHAGWQRAEQSLVEANLSAGRLRYDARDGSYPDGTFTRLRLSWSLPVGERTVLRLAGGGASWQFATTWDDAPTRDDQQVLAPEGEIGLHWDYEEDSFVDLHLARTTERGVDSNLAAVDDVGIFGRLAILHTRGIDAELGWTRVTASSGIDGPERRWGYRAGTGAELYYSAGWLWRLSVNYTDSRARIAEPFARTISALQVTVAY
jgi:hypothetical protein